MIVYMFRPTVALLTLCFDALQSKNHKLKLTEQLQFQDRAIGCLQSHDFDCVQIKMGLRK